MIWGGCLGGMVCLLIFYCINRFVNDVVVNKNCWESELKKEIRNDYFK